MLSIVRLMILCRLCLAMYCLYHVYCLYCSGYSTKKLQENVECEIMMVVLEEATDSYK